MFDNEVTWLFICVGVVGCFCAHGFWKYEQEAQKTMQVEIRARVELEVMRMAATNAVRAARVPDGGRGPEAL